MSHYTEQLLAQLRAVDMALEAEAQRIAELAPEQPPPPPADDTF